MERKEESGFTVERWARGAAWQAGHGATASSLLRRQLLLDLLQPRALLEAAHAIDHPWGHVSPDTRLASVGLMGKTWEVPRRVLTTTQRQSWLKEISCTWKTGVTWEWSHQRAHIQQSGHVLNTNLDSKWERNASSLGNILNFGAFINELSIQHILWAALYFTVPNFMYFSKYSEIMQTNHAAKCCRKPQDLGVVFK